jgi:hypothetical protein
MMLAPNSGDKAVLPVLLSTVTPGKLPTCWLSPVRALNKELFPLLGLPTNAICKRAFFNSGIACKNKPGVPILFTNYDF